MGLRHINKFSDYSISRKSQITPYELQLNPELK